MVQGVFALLLHGVRGGKGRGAKQERNAGRDLGQAENSGQFRYGA